MKYRFEFAPDVQEIANDVINTLDLAHVVPNRVVYMRGYGASTRAIARIWSLPRIWQKALNVDAHYVIEVMSERYDRLTQEEKEKTVIHELLHVPKTFSGHLVPHKCFGKMRVNSEAVNVLYDEYKKKRG